MEELTRSRIKDPNSKSLVFSQFVNLLDLVCSQAQYTLDSTLNLFRIDRMAVTNGGIQMRKIRWKDEYTSEKCGNTKIP